MQWISLKANHKYFDKKSLKEHYWECTVLSTSLSIHPQRKEFHLFFQNYTLFPAVSTSSVSVGKLKN